MSFVNKYPYTDFHELNLDWILDRIHKLGVDMDEFKALNTITFSGVWNITQQYPAWTVVNDNNLGYISIRPVPAGITISNTDYWASIVDYSAELAGIHNDITNLQNDVADINAELSDGKWVFFGDSYQNYADWYSKVCADLKLTNNVNAFYAGASGHGFTVSGMTWESDFDTFCAGRTDLAEFKHVIVCGGLNDSVPAVLTSDAATLRTAINSFFADVQSKMPNATVSVGYIGSAESDSGVLAGRDNDNRMLAIYVYHDQVTKNKGKVLQNVEYIMHSHTQFESDGLHPKSGIGDVMGRYIAEAILNGECHVLDFLNDAGTLNFVDSELKIYGGVNNIIDNGVSKLVMNTIFTGTVLTAFTIGSTYTDLGEIPTKIFMRNTKEVPAVAITSDASNAYELKVYAKIENRRLKIRSAEFSNRNTQKTLTVGASNRLDLGTITFIEDTLETM
ncbi:MAG: SGNH/GDSL hydrolase family protein [Clostridia bacterium]|nr:SGNH/GDSL hydrolase family protein [Clostridia bacterium]